MRKITSAVCGLIGLICVSCAKAPPPPPPLESQPASVQYIARLQQAIGRARSQMKTITSTAEQAAGRVVEGGKLYAGGSQAEFGPELCGRAGGLMGIKPLPDDLNVGPQDVVLYAGRSSLTQDDELRISRLRQAGAMLILFSSGGTIDSGKERGLPLRVNKICPADTVINIINGWTWTGEFIAACTRLGKMPTVYKGYHLEGGMERGKRYEGQTFHTDMQIDAIKPGVLGNAYLTQLGRYLLAVRGDAPVALHLAAAKLREATAARSVFQVTGHMFPQHYKDVRAPQPFGTMSHLNPNVPLPAGQMMTVLGYQQAPQLAIDAAHVHRDFLLYSSVQRGRDDKAPFINYVNPQFPMDDACVEIKGYDIAALPASGVMQAAIYWALVAETYPPRAPGN